MRKAIVILVVAAVLIGFGALLTQQQSTPDEPKTLASGTVVYDVRTAEEYAASHAKDAILFPLQDIEAGKTPDVDKSTPIAVYCRSGNRSTQATELLKKAGFTNITDLGGLTDLKKYGIELTT